MQDSLGTVVAAMIPFALAGVFVPSWTKYVIILLGSGKPLVNAVSYVAGNAAFRLILGVLVLLSFNIEFVEDTADNPPGGPRVYLIILGLALISIGIYLLRKRPRDTEDLPKWLQALEHIKPWMAFGAGFAMMALPGVQYVYFLGGMGVVARSTLDVVAQLVLLLVFTAFLELMLLAPIGIYVLGGDRAAARMEAFKLWLGRNEFKVFGVILGAFGFFVLIAAL